MVTNDRFSSYRIRAVTVPVMWRLPAYGGPADFRGLMRPLRKFDLDSKTPPELTYFYITPTPLSRKYYNVEELNISLANFARGRLDEVVRSSGPKTVRDVVRPKPGRLEPPPATPIPGQRRLIFNSVCEIRPVNRWYVNCPIIIMSTVMSAYRTARRG